MSGGRPQPRWSFVISGTKAAPPASQIVRHGKVPKECSGPGLTATAAAKEIRCLPSDLQHPQHQLFANKVVLCFESEYTTQDVWTWLRTYNQTCCAHHSLFNKPPNAVFVVKFEAVDWTGTKRALLDASPLKAGEAYASFWE